MPIFDVEFKRGSRFDIQEIEADDADAAKAEITRRYKDQGLPITFLSVEASDEPTALPEDDPEEVAAFKADTGGVNVGKTPRSGAIDKLKQLDATRVRAPIYRD